MLRDLPMGEGAFIGAFMQPKPVALKVLDIISIILLGVATYLALVFAPTELVMGDVQRVFTSTLAPPGLHYLASSSQRYSV